MLDDIYKKRLLLRHILQASYHATVYTSKGECQAVYKRASSDGRSSCQIILFLEYIYTKVLIRI